MTIAAVAAVLYAWNITSAGYAYYYSNAVKSMSVSWKALLFGAMDPGATITPDKIAGSFVPQALSARIFGFHAWAVTLPQCVEGVIAVLVMYRVVRRWAGPRAGLAAAALFTFTPVAASMFGHSMEDGALVFCLVMAADSYQRAVTDARLRSLLLSGVWVGIGFQAKMMQAWMILPALALGYLVVAPVRLRRRAGHLLLAGVVCAAVSLSWVALMTLVPAKDRPYVDGSTDNSAVAMVFGYNGLGRFGIHLPGAVASMGGGGGFRGANGRTDREGFPGAGAGRFGGTGATGGRPGAGSASGGTGAAGFGGGSGGASGFRSTGTAPASGGTSATGGTSASGGFGSAGGGGAAGGFGGRPSASGGNGAARGFGGTAAGGRTLPRAGRGGFGGFGGRDGSGWLKLFQGRFAPQIGWMYPFALLGLAFGFWWRRRGGRDDRLRGGFVMWGGWLVVVGLVFSKMSSIPHTAYMSTLAPALAALAGAGGVMMWDAYRKGARSGWALPLAVAAEAVWTWHLSSAESGFLPWLRWLALAASVVGIVAMVWGRIGRRARSRLLVTAALTGLAGAVITPVAWSASVLDLKYAGSAFDAGAGPTAMGGGMGMPMGGGTRTGTAGGGPQRAGGFTGPGGNVSTALSADERKLYDYVKARQGGAAYVLATDGWTSASPYILATGDKVMPMGGFSGSVPQPSLGGVESLVHSGGLRYVLVSGAGRGFPGMGGAGGSGSVTAIDSWVKKDCAEVPSTAYGVKQPATGTNTAAGRGPFAAFGAGGGTGTLYDCAPKAGA
jgi:4-amino-4-deoxy-L-arabinose transferase-like glycosyltransferase